MEGPQAVFINNVLSQIVATFASAAIAAVLYSNYLLFEAYCMPILWALLLSQALKDKKDQMVQWLRDVLSLIHI